MKALQALGASLRQATAGIRQAGEDFAACLRSCDLHDLDAQLQRQRAAEANPGDLKSAPSIATGWMTPRERRPFWRHLPDPLARRGRPKSNAAARAEALSDMAALVAAGCTEREAARQILAQCASKGADRQRVDYLVRQYRLKKDLQN